MKRRSVLVFVALVTFLLVLQSACSSNAKIQVQSLDRVAMQDKINVLDGGPDASKNYKELTAKLTDEERDSLNTLLARVIDRSPSKADKKATVASILTSVESVRKESSLQGKVKSAIDSLLAISLTLDASMRAISDGLQFAPVNSKILYLTLAESVGKRSASDANILGAIEAGLPPLGGEFVFNSSAGWDKIPSETSVAAEYLSTVLKIAPFTAANDLEKFITRAIDGKLQNKILEGLRGLSSTDSQLGNIIKVQNAVPEDSLSGFNVILSQYSTSSSASDLKTAILDALKKSLVLRTPLLSYFITEVQSSATKSDAVILINGLIDSIDKTAGEGYFSQPKFTTKSISPYTVPGCTLPGSSTTKVTYSFKWKKNGATLVDWTSQSFERLASAGSLFALEDSTQCFVRVYVDGIKVAELNTELFTVRSMPPIFTSGEPPQEQTFSAPKSVGFVYKVAVRDPISDTDVFYRIVELPKHGVVTQTDIGTFDYKPLPAYIGSDVFKFVACNLDDMCSSEKVITLNVVDGNQPPRLDRIVAPAQNTIAGGIQMSSDSTLSNIQFIIDDDDIVGSSCGIPNVIVTSGNTSRFPQSSANIELTGTFPYCKLKLAPAAGSAGLGTTTLTIKLDDGTNPQVTSTVDVTVLDKTPQWATPATSTTFTINKNSGANTLYLNAATDADAGLFLTPQTLTYVIDSSPASGVGSLTSASAVPSSGNGTIVFTPTAGSSTTADQTTTFTYKVCDNATPQNCTATKPVTVNVINNAPTISAIANPAAFSEGSNTGAISFTIGDIDDNITCSNVSKASSNISLIPVDNIDIGGSGTSCNVTVTPVADGNGGPVAITLSLNHKSATIDRTFLVSVNAVNDQPAIVSTSGTPATTASSGTFSTQPYTHIQTVATPLTEDGGTQNIALATATDVDASVTGSANGSPQYLYYNLVVPPARGVLSSGNISGVMNISSTASPLSGATVTYTPLPNENGSDGFVYKICDNSGAVNNCTENIYVSLTISAQNDKPYFTSAGDTSATVEVGNTVSISLGGGADIDTTAGAAGSLAPVATLVTAPTQGSLSGAAAGATITSPITYTPGTIQAGIYTFSYQYCDTGGLCSDEIKTVTITVTQRRMTSIENQIINEGSNTGALSFKLLDFGTGYDCVAGSGITGVSASSGDEDIIPNGNIAVSGTNNNCSVTVTPAVNSNGGPVTVTLSIALADGGNVQQSFTVTVLQSNDTPTLNASGATPGITDISTTISGISVAHRHNLPASLSTTEDSISSGIILMLGEDVDTDATLNSNPQTLQYHLVLAPQNGILSTGNLLGVMNGVSATSTATRTITYTPNLNYNGPDEFIYKVCDSSGLAATSSCSANVHVPITVTADNDSPLLVPAATTSFKASAQAPKDITLSSATDVDTGQTVVAKLVTQPTNGTLSDPSNSSTTYTAADSVLPATVRYTPSNAASPGTDSFTYKLCDNSGAANACTAVQTMTIEIVGTTPMFNGAATSSIFNLAESETVTIALDGAIDPDASLFGTPQTLSYTLSSVSLGTLGAPSAVPGTSSGTGSVSFTSNGTSGVQNLTYKVCDNFGTPNCTAEKEITINIGTPTYPVQIVAGTSSDTTSDGAAKTITLGKFTDPVSTTTSLQYVFTLNGARMSGFAGLNPRSDSRSATYTPPDVLAGSETLKYQVCTTSVTPQRCSVESSIVMTRTTTYAAPTLTGGDSLVVVTETPGNGGGTVNINLATATTAGSNGITLTYNILQGPQNQSGKAVVNGVPIGSLGTLPTDASPGSKSVSYTLRSDIYAGASDQIVYQVCQSAPPSLCSASKSVSIAIIASDDPPTATSLGLDSGGAPLKLTGAAQGPKTFSMTFTLADSDSVVTCSNVSLTSSNAALFPAPTIAGAAQSCSFNLVSANGSSGDSDIQLKIGSTALKLNETNETFFRATVLALDGANKAIHLCVGATQSISNRPVGVSDPIQGIAQCKDYVATGWDATAALDSSKFFRSINNSQLPDPRKYCTGLKLFGYQGMAYCGAGKDPLNLHRTVGTLALNSSTTPGSDYRLFPDPAKDHDAQTVGSSGVTKLGTRPANVCGTSGALEARIAACANANGSLSYWDGSVKGNAGQALWRLVTVKPVSGSDCASGCTEVWRDERTGLLWSDVIVDSSVTPIETWNWCKASGNSNALSNPPSKEDDQDSGVSVRCADATHQGQDDTGANMPTSLCTDDAAFKTLDSRQKLSHGELDLTSSPKIRWWLPTRSEWLRAERNGLRFVLPNMASEFWTATVNSADSTKAWIFDGSTGGKLASAARTDSKKVRCVGSP